MFIKWGIMPPWGDLEGDLAKEINLSVFKINIFTWLSENLRMDDSNGFWQKYYSHGFFIYRLWYVTGQCGPQEMFT